MENFGNPVKLEISLQRLAMITVITHIYKDPVIKDQMELILFIAAKPVEPLNREINKLVHEKLKNLNLPKVTMKEAEGLVIILTKKLVNWVYWVVKVLKFETSYLDEIYWTSIGTIDEAKIFDEYWKKHGSFSDVTTIEHKRANMVHILASIYANEEIILSLQNSMIKKLQQLKCLQRFKVTKMLNKINEIIAVYMCKSFGKDYDQFYFTEIYKRFLLSGKGKIDEIIFIAGFQGLNHCTKFFWKLLSDSKKKEIAPQLANKILDGDEYFSTFKSESDHYYEIDLTSRAELLYFLINEMTEQQRNEFLRKKILKVFRSFFKVWPYDEICYQILEQEWILNAQAGDDLKQVLRALMFRLIELDPSELFVYGNKLHEIFRSVMKIAPKSYKYFLLWQPIIPNQEEDYFVTILEKFYERFDITALSIIINDADLFDCRDNFITIGLYSNKISELKKDNNCELLISFMDKVLTSNDERKQFMRKFKLEEIFLNMDDSCLRQKVLDWQSV